jgi:fatty acid desaturase
MVSTPSSAALLPRSVLAELNSCRDRPGVIRLFSHLVTIGFGGWLWANAGLPVPVRLVGLLLSGIGLATAFAPLHECCHRTAFRRRRVNDVVAWCAGLLCFYNSTFYRRYHQWHHRYAHQIGLDPELDDGFPTTRWAYVLEISGWNWWIGKWRGYYQLLFGDLSGLDYLNPEVIPQIRRSVRLQFTVYGVLALVSVLNGSGFLLWSWLLPLAVGQPFLRFMLLAEHSGCSFDRDGTTNTRTTLTHPLVAWQMWNMPYHAEHHLYASLPFHSLAAAHRWIGPELKHLDPGYLFVHRKLLRNLSAWAVPQ